MLGAAVYPNRFRNFSRPVWESSKTWRRTSGLKLLHPDKQQRTEEINITFRMDVSFKNPWLIYFFSLQTDLKIVATIESSLVHVYHVYCTACLSVWGFNCGSFLFVCSGSPEERGIRKLKRGAGLSAAELEGMRSYDLPFGMDFIRRHSIFKYIPISPTFTGYQFGRLQETCRSRMGHGDVVKGGGIGGEGGATLGESRV